MDDHSAHKRLSTQRVKGREQSTSAKKISHALSGMRVSVPMLIAASNTTCAQCAVVLTRGWIVISGPEMSLCLILRRSPLNLNRTPLRPHAKEPIRSDYLQTNKQVCFLTIPIALHCPVAITPLNFLSLESGEKKINIETKIA